MRKAWPLFWRRHALLVVSLSLLAGPWACEVDRGDPATENLPCDPDGSCPQDLVCIDGFCVADPCIEVECDSGEVCVLGACHADDQGGLGQPCYSNETCNAPYVCEDDTCVEPGGSVTAGECSSLPNEDPEWGTIYYVRTDGGTAEQCDGTTDAAYPGSGTGEACAWNHPFAALPPGGSPRISGGDKLVIGSGEYRIGYGAPGAESCYAGGSFDCTMAAVPSGPDAAHPTRIYGAGYDSGCSEPPQLWGTERVWHVLDLTNTSHARIACLEITDHEGCVESHSGSLTCNRDQAPYGDWASVGITARDSTDVGLCNLDVHGLAHTGIRAGRLTDWTVENVRVAANGWVGWDGDIEGDDSNSGTMLFRHWTVEWNGCGETYPGGEPQGCWGQTAGGYGDGVGTGATGADWVIEDSVFSFNTSDGLDLLYHSGDGTITLDRVRAEGNAGNQLKTRGPTTIRNSVVVGNCGFFDGKSFTHHVDNCRAAGNALSLGADTGNAITLFNNTIYSEGDCLLLISGSACNGTETLTTRNNIFIGDDDFLQPGDQSCFLYSECTGMTFDHDYNIIVGTKGDPCPTGPNDICDDPLLADPSPESFDAHLQSGSPAIDTGQDVGGIVPSEDIEGTARPQGAGVDIGAYEMP